MNPPYGKKRYFEQFLHINNPWKGIYYVEARILPNIVRIFSFFNKFPFLKFPFNNFCINSSSNLFTFQIDSNHV